MSDRGSRDHSVDAARAFAICGVVGGHWLVTGLVLDDDGVLRQVSPLAALPGFTPLSWVLQTLGLFFFAGGFAAARSARAFPPRRLVRPLCWLIGLWTYGLAMAWALGVPVGTLRTIAVLVVSPLWFLLPYLALTAVTRGLVRVVDRAGPVAALAGVPVVALSDLGLLPGWTAIPAAWSVPWILGVALARGRLGGGRALTLTGISGMAVLIGVLGYPTGAVGVPGQGRSNLDPPSLVAVALATAQIGGFLMVRRRVARASRVITAVNRRALPIYLGHQSVLVLVAAVAAWSGARAPGLLTAPDGPGWAVQRLVWLPVLTAVLAAIVGFRPARSDDRRPGGRARAH
jgi:acyltransferase-like protein